jgi:hypothetical protein
MKLKWEFNTNICFLFQKWADECHNRWVGVLYDQLLKGSSKSYIILVKLIAAKIEQINATVRN